MEELKDEKRSQERLMMDMKAETEEKISKMTEETNAKIESKQKELDVVRTNESELINRIQQLTIVEDELRDKFHSSELEFSEKLQQATMREKELTEKIVQLTKHLEEMKIQSDAEKRELKEKLNLSEEVSMIRNSRNNANESFHNKTLNSSQILQDEVESLRCVLELKQSEISELRKTNCELQRAADEAIAAQVKCSALESRVEDLQVQLHAKNEEEK